MYEISYSYKVPEWATITVEDAVSAPEAETIALREIQDLYPDISDIEVTDVKEITDGA